MPYYAVRQGHKTGIYDTWNECQAQTKGYKGPQFKKFESEAEANVYLNEKSGQKSKKRTSEGASSKSDLPPPAKKKKDKPETSDEKHTDPAEDTQDVVEVYTYGQMNGAKAGIGIYWGPDHDMNVGAPLPGHMKASKNVAEIYACTKAITQAKEHSYLKLKLLTDSQYVISCMTQWINGWKKKDWVTGAGKPVMNKTELLELDEARKGIDIEWAHVKGQSGNAGNEAADKLSKKGAAGYKADSVDAS